MCVWMHRGLCCQRGQQKTPSLCRSPVALWFVSALLKVSAVWAGRSSPWTLRVGNTKSRSRFRAWRRLHRSWARTRRPRPGASPDYFPFPRPSGDFLNRAETWLPPRRWCGSALGCQGNSWAALSSGGKWGCRTGWGRGVLCLGPMSLELKGRKWATKIYTLNMVRFRTILLYELLNL